MQNLSKLSEEFGNEGAEMNNLTLLQTPFPHLISAMDQFYFVVYPTFKEDSVNLRFTKDTVNENCFYSIKTFFDEQMNLVGLCVDEPKNTSISSSICIKCSCT